MGRITVVFGVVLIALGLVGYFATDRVSLTALFPSFFGIALVVLGLLASKDNLRKHVMHLAAVVGLVGFVVPAVFSFPNLPRLLAGERIMVPARAGGLRDATIGNIMQIAMALICLAFVGLCVKSFVDARRSRARAAAES